MPNLSQLSKKAPRGRVLHIAGEDEIAQRLLEMGITPGAEIQFVGAALLGDPLEFELRGYRLSLRKREAARVEIETLDALG